MTLSRLRLWRIYASVSSRRNWVVSMQPSSPTAMGKSLPRLTSGSSTPYTPSVSMRWEAPSSSPSIRRRRTTGTLKITPPISRRSKSTPNCPPRLQRSLRRPSYSQQSQTRSRASLWRVGSKEVNHRQTGLGGETSRVPWCRLRRCACLT